MTKNRNKPTLRIYVGKHCWSCDETLRLAEEAKARFANLNVELIDLDAEDSVNLDNVFSVPTYVLNGRTVSLGNPASDQFFRQLSEALA
ncbi:MAG: thioredoxin family protein [Acidobacteria bacterium]|nr:thioredoxin family protein [Acidobacteriota bacterium]